MTGKLKFLSFLLVAFCSQLVFAQNKTSIDVPMKTRGLMPAVEVMVNGKGPFLFAIDTGAQGKARVDASLLKQLDLKIVGEVQGGDPSGRNMRAMPVVRLDSLKIGDLEFRDVEAASRDYNTSPNLPRIDGIIGFELFAAHLLTLDFPARRVRVAAGELLKANGKDIIDFERTRGIPEIEIEVGSQKIKADVDSGNAVGGLILPAAVVEKANLAGQPVVVGRARTISNEFEIKEVRLKDTIRLGGFEFADETISFPPPAQANLGAAFMQDFALTFDQKNKRMKLEKAKTAATKLLVKPEKFKEYAGVFGERTVTDEGGNLYLQRSGGMKMRLVAVSTDEFTLARLPEARLKFNRDASGKITELEILNQSGNWEKIKRN